MKLFRHFLPQQRRASRTRSHRRSGQLPGTWLRLLGGYLGAALLCVLSVAITYALVYFVPSFAYPGSPCILAILVIALLWGAGPSLFATLLAALLLDFVVLPPTFSWSLHTLEKGLDIGMFLLIGFIISQVASRIKHARQETLMAWRTAATRARQLEATIESITDGVVVCDLGGHIQQANAAFRRLFSSEMDSESDFSLHGLRSPWRLLRNTEGEPLPQEQWPLLRMLREKPPEGPRTLDLLSCTEAGKDRFLNVSDAPVTDVTGRIIGGVAVFRDVTEHRRLEQRTRQALDALLAMAQVVVEAPLEERASTKKIDGDMQHTASALASLIRHVLGCKRVGIVATRTDDSYLHPLAVSGCKPKEERQWFAEVSRLRIEDVLTACVAAPLSQGEVVLSSLSERARQLLAVGEHSFTLASPLQVGPRLLGLLLLGFGAAAGAPTEEERALVGAVGRLVALVIERERLWHEWAEARANELALRDATRHMDTFLGIAGHELKTPLTVIKGNLQLAKWQAQQLASGQDGDAHEGVDDLGPLPNMLAHAEQQVNRLTRLVNDLIEVSRIRIDTLKMHTERCDLTAIVQEAIEEQRVVFPARTINLEEPVPPAPQVFADADRIGEVMNNFLINALKYSASDQPIEVRMERSGQDIRVLVRDRGPGLTTEQQVQVWDRFQRVQDIKVQDGSSVGLGLGLFICRMIIEQHHGQVGVESTPGEGSTFWFSLPLLQTPLKKKRK